MNKCIEKLETCPCFERGRDGTFAHTEPVDYFLEQRSASRFSHFRPCRNHELNYEGNPTFKKLPLVLSSEPADAEQWNDLIAEANRISLLLKKKPAELRLRFAACPGGILNAYREGDLTFDEAVVHLERWKDRELADRVRPV